MFSLSKIVVVAWREKKQEPASEEQPYHGGGDIEQVYSQTEANILPDTADEPDG